MDRSLEVTACSVGNEHPEYVGSLNIKGNLLGAMKRYGEVMDAHDDALAIIRRVAAARPVPEVIGTWSRSSTTWRPTYSGMRGGRSRRALVLLDDADAHVERGECGWTEIRLNRAEALRLLGRLEEAEAILRDLGEFSERVYGNPSLQLTSPHSPTWPRCRRRRGARTTSDLPAGARGRRRTCRTSPIRTTPTPKAAATTRRTVHDLIVP
jgi:hypothetical protein